MRARTLVTAAALAASVLAPLAAAAPAHAAATNVYDDFDGDGYRDVAYSYRGGSVMPKGGAVLIRYGAAGGLYSGRTQVISQDSPGIPGGSEENDNFGTQLSSADVNKDGYADLVVGNTWEAVDGLDNRGMVTVVWGGSSGLSGGRTLPAPVNTEYGHFGWGIATGDFNGDGSPDIVTLAYGSAWLHRGPITATSTGQVSRIDKDGFDPEYVAAGRVTADSRTDLVLGGTQSDSTGFHASVWFLKGASTGLTSGPAKRLTASSNPFSLPELSLAVGDFDKDSYGDIAIGNPGDSSFRGAVTLWYGSSTGASTTRATVKITQNSTGVPGSAEANDTFGSSVSAADTNGDGYRDLAVGVSNEDSGKGGVTLFRGGSGGISGSRSVWLSQDTAGVAGTAESGDLFGYDVRLRDGNGDGRADLLVSAVNDSVANVLPGSSTGPTGTGSVVLDELAGDGLLD